MYEEYLTSTAQYRRHGDALGMARKSKPVLMKKKLSLFFFVFLAGFSDQTLKKNHHNSTNTLVAISVSKLQLFEWAEERIGF